MRIILIFTQGQIPILLKSRNRDVTIDDNTVLPPTLWPVKNDYYY